MHHSDKREFDRKSLEVEVDLYSHDNFYAGITGDISEGGLFVATYTPPPVGAMLDICVVLPGGFRIAARGQVRWIRSVDAARDGNMPGCGLRFLELTADALASIREFVSHRETLYFDDDVVAA